MSLTPETARQFLTSQNVEVNALHIPDVRELIVDCRRKLTDCTCPDFEKQVRAQLDLLTTDLPTAVARENARDFLYKFRDSSLQFSSSEDWKNFLQDEVLHPFMLSSDRTVELLRYAFYSYLLGKAKQHFQVAQYNHNEYGELIDIIGLEIEKILE